ncbi:MAG: N-acetyltransferase, partial [Eubacteriales bacterium]|nr:N-acetyltransferase [Eubacteriales bacterium]
MNIRQETEKDYNEVFELIKKAFENAEHSDGNEQNLVTKLRKSTAFIPELSLVADYNGKIVGHILFSKIIIGNSNQIALAPVSVLPEFQKQGIGAKLI